MWPKPMDGLDLFVPVVVATSSSSESESEGMDDSEGLNDEERNSESDYQGDTRNDVMIPSKPWKVPGGLVLTINSRKVAEVDCTSPEVEVVEDRDFEIEKVSHVIYLKPTFYMLCVATRVEDNHQEEWSTLFDWQRCVACGCVVVGCVACGCGSRVWHVGGCGSRVCGMWVW